MVLDFYQGVHSRRGSRRNMISVLELRFVREQCLISCEVNNMSRVSSLPKLDRVEVHRWFIRFLNSQHHSSHVILEMPRILNMGAGASQIIKSGKRATIQ